MLHMLAAFAEHEREMISQRTKATLEAACARGARLGNPRWQEAPKKARAAVSYVPVPPLSQASWPRLASRAPHCKTSPHI